MRWHKKTIRAVNTTRGTLVGESIRVAETGLTRIVGLLGERELPPGDGLLIVPSQGVHTLGMRFAIDVAFLDGQWNVIAIKRDLRPFRMTRLFWKAAADVLNPDTAWVFGGTPGGEGIKVPTGREA